VLVHGITMSWRAWQSVIPLLAERHEVFAPSLAGHHGAAPTVPGAVVSVPALTDALEAQLDDAGIDTAHIAGNSLGGWIALELARRHRARSVVVFSPAGGWREQRDLRRIIRMVRLGRVFAHHPLLGAMLTRPRMRQAILRGVTERGHDMASAEASQLFEDAQRCTALRGLLASMKHDGPFALADPSCPIRIAWPQHDRTIPFTRYGQPLADAVPGAELVSLLGVGHVPMYDNPQLVADTILELTTRVDEMSTPASPGPANRPRHLLGRWRGGDRIRRLFPRAG
jgi:pimeloyl-ACP methyl ester carboxylesterase